MPIAPLAALLPVFVSLLMGNFMTLELNNPVVIAVIEASIIAPLTVRDKRSNWLEGDMLLVVCAMLTLGFFLLPEIV